METITASEARANFAEILGRVSFGKERITIERSGKPVALLVPVPDAGSTAIDNDITERQRAEERFRRYFDLPLVGSAIYAPDKKWIAVNDAEAEAVAVAVAYVELASGGVTLFGVGRHRNITAASLSAVVSGVNRLMKDRG